MRAYEYFNWENARFTNLYEPTRNVMSAFGNAEKWFAAIKDVVLVDMGMTNLSDHIHRLEHLQPERVDSFAEAIHAHGLLLPYPATPELAESFDNDLDRVFEVCIRIVDEICEELSKWIQLADVNNLRDIALKAEEVLLESSLDRTKLIEAWKMWDNGEMSRASFDNWCLHHFNREDG